VLGSTFPSHNIILILKGFIFPLAFIWKNI